jgi:hypothetical protein
MPLAETISSSTSSSITITVLYRLVPNFQFDMGYYLSKHIPLAKEAWEPCGMTSCKVFEIDNNDEYAVGVAMEWTDMAAWEKAQEDGPRINKIGEDVKNFTNSSSVFIVGRIVG